MDLYLDIGFNAARVGLVHQANISISLNDHAEKENLLFAIAIIPQTDYFGVYNVSRGATAIQSMIGEFEGNARPGVKRIAVILTDGNSVNENGTIPAAEQAKRDHNVTIFAIGLTGEAGEEELIALSSWPHQLGRNYWLVDSFYTGADDIGGNLFDAICSKDQAPGLYYRRLQQSALVSNSVAHCTKLHAIE